MDISAEALGQEWDRMAPRWIERCRAGEPNRAGLLDAWMARLAGPAEGLRVIDLGCGEGRFCRFLAQQGAAHVLGVDRCRPLLEAAEQARATDREAYRRADLQKLAGIPAHTFDLAVSYLSLVDVPDLAAAVAACHRVLRPGGRFVVCNLSPMATAVNHRITEADGTRVALRVDHYFDETTRVMTMLGHTLTNFHRTLSTYVNTFIGGGFVLAGLYEPYPAAADLERYPEQANELRAPSFVIYDLVKPSY